MALTTQPAKFEVSWPLSFGETVRTMFSIWPRMFSTHPITTILFAILVLIGLYAVLTAPPARRRRKRRRRRD